MKTPIPLAKAERAAQTILEALKPFCDQIEIAGSIRRRKELVGDIDLVALPSDFNAMRERIVQNKEIVQDGRQNIHVRMTNGMEINVFVARPEVKTLFESVPSNWGSLLLLRTGSREFNIKMVERAKSLGLAWNPYHGIFSEGKNVASVTEADLFRVLELEFIQPQDRDVVGRFSLAPFDLRRRINSESAPSAKSAVETPS